jgi:uncharacterized protein with beta-barrel porin domain
MILKNKSLVKNSDKTEDTLNSLKNFSKKALKVLPLAGIATIAATAAYGANVDNGVTDDDATEQDWIFDIATKDLTLTSDRSTPVYVIKTGDITDNASAADIILTSHASDTATLSATIKSAVLDSGTAGVITVSDLNGAEGQLNLTFTGTLTTGTTLIVNALEQTAGETITINFDGATTIAGLVTTVNDGSSVTQAVDLIASAAYTASAGTVLSANATAQAQLIFDGTGTQAVTGKINGDDDNEGNVLVTNAAGLVSFATAIGGDNDTKNVTIGTSTNDSSAAFAAAVNSQSITIVSGESVGENSSATFDAAVTGALVLTPGAASTASVDFLDTNAITALTGAITTTSTDGDDTTVNVYDDATGAPALQTFTGAIGTSTNKIGTLAIGQVNGKAGDGNFDADINVTNLTITADNGTGEASRGQFDGNVTATTITLDDDTNTATLELLTAATKTLTGTINGAGDNEGTLLITNTGKTVAGTVGVTNPLLLVNVDATVAFSSSVNAQGYNVADSSIASMAGAAITAGTDNLVLAGEAGELTLTGTVAQTVAGSVLGSADGKGILDNANTSNTVTFSGAVGATELQEVELDDDSTTVFQAAVKAKVLDLDSGTVTFEENGNLFNALTTEAATTVIVGNAVANGEELILEATGADANSIVTGTTIIMPSTLTDGQSIVLIAQTTQAANVAILADLEAAVSDTALMSYTGTATVNATNDVDLLFTATTNAGSAIGSSLGVTDNMGIAMGEANNAIQTNATLRNTLNDMLLARNSRTLSEATDLAKQVAPQQDLIVGSAVASKAMTGAVQGVVANRMASLRSGDAYVAGMSAGEGLSANSMFLQAFGSIAQQDSRIVNSGHQPGFDADTAGVALGFDSITDGGLVVGLSVSMSNTDLEGKGTGKAVNDIDSYTASLYMDKTSDTGYIEGSFTYGISENATSRIINTADLDRTLKGEYDSQSISVKLGGGLPYEASNGAFVTPFASVTGTLIETDAYTETSNTAADELRLRVDQDDINSIVGSLGIKAHMDTGSGVPMISLAVNNEFGDNKMKQTNTFQGGGNAFKTSTAIEEMSATLGVGYTFTNGNTDVNVGYEAEANQEDYLGHYGTVKLTSRF